MVNDNFAIFYEQYSEVLVRKRDDPSYQNFFKDPKRFDEFPALAFYEGSLVIC